MPNYFLYVRDDAIYHAYMKSHPKLKQTYTEETTQDKDIFENFELYKKIEGEWQKQKSNEDKKNAHLASYSQVLIDDGYEGDLESITEIDAYFLQKYNDAQNDTERISVVFLASRVTGYFAASMYRGNIKS